MPADIPLIATLVQELAIYEQFAEYAAIRFYAGLGVKPMDEWTIQRLTGDALREFVES